MPVVRTGQLRRVLLAAGLAHGVAAVTPAPARSQQSSPPRGTEPASGETIVEFNNDSRTLVALRVDPTALQGWLPAAWDVDPAPVGPFAGANLLLIFINPWLTQNPQGKLTSVPIDRRVLLVVPAKNRQTAEATILVARSYDANAKGLPGPYRNSVVAAIRLEQTLTGSGTDPAFGTELWEASVDGGAIELHLQYQRGVAMQSNAETRPRSAVDPTLQRIYRANQGLDLVRSLPLGIDRVQSYSLRVTISELRNVFDGSEQLVSLALFPWYLRQVSLPR